VELKTKLAEQQPARPPQAQIWKDGVSASAEIKTADGTSNALAKPCGSTHAGKLSYGHVGVGSTTQLTGELFKLLAGLPELIQVPYRGAGPAIADLISGQVAMAVVAVTGQSLGFHRSGQLRILAVTSPKRLIAAPELPTVADAGFPDLTSLQTIGPVAPAGTPRPIIDQIAQAVRTALADPAYQQNLIDSGFEASPDTTPEKFRRRLEADVVFWTPVVEALGLKID
jgi:tripartite-type tricarboxylate transporter receptor subunit TctC